MEGTPKTLFEAILNGMLMGPMKDMPQNVEVCVKDFLRQVTGTALLKYDECKEPIEYIIARLDLEGPSKVQAVWNAINRVDLRTLENLIRSHPEVVSVDLVTATDLERMAANDG